MKVNELNPAAYNPRRITPERLDQLGRSMKKFGDLSSIVFNRRTGRLVGGHQRIKHLDPNWVIDKTPAKDKVGTVAVGRISPSGSTSWAYREVDWDEATEKAANIAANAAGGEFDNKVLEKLVGELNAGGFDMGLLNLQDLDALVASSLPQPESAEEIPELPKKPVTKPGDVWKLGPHRIICGDVTEVGVVRKLFDGAKAAIAVTSPPYASQRKYDESSGFKPIHPDKYVEWFEDVAKAVETTLADGGSFFLNIKEHCEEGERHLYVKDLVIAHVREWGWRFVDEFVWTHGGTPKAPRNRFKNGWEPIFQFTRGAHRFYPRSVRKLSDNVPKWNGLHPAQDDGTKMTKKRKTTNMVLLQGFESAIDNDTVQEGFAYPSNVITVGKNREALGHGAAYPLGLPEFFIMAYTKKGEVVFDPFGGSGTTLIAAERKERVGYTAEISPGYCDVIVKRWETVTGRKATRS